ncbi:spore gernimation protein KB [Mesobacillus campisalis]|uniref:Spore gernimation protein KB n=1 Tax=Mesobacillus campisalis TaxID=1408103 RepID=A0A0M2T1I3_9BACI|nr:spore germination protein [Mesobacillus campisalis]KKK38680.1 spore gernimation protein KB [Mesobacillus campisalis]
MPSFFKSKKRKARKRNNQHSQPPEFCQVIHPSLADQLDYIRNKTGSSTDIVIRKASFDEKLGIRTAIVYVEGISDKKTINDFLIESIIKNRELHEKHPKRDPFDILLDEVVALGDVAVHHQWDSIFQSLMAGDTVILIDGFSKALSASTRGGEQRSIEEPGSQVTVRGPRDGFTESIGTNIALIRRRIQNPDLWNEMMKIGTVTKTDVAIVYIKGIAKDEIVDEIRSRLKRIEIDSILESGYIEQLTEEHVLTTFPTYYHTERPDMVAGNLLEGRVAIIVNGTPFVLIAPALFIQFFQSVEDYYGRADIATALRFLRILIFFISIIAPASYIAGTTFHQEMIPTRLLIAIAAQRETVPFPAFVEALIMEVAFEILREAGVRMPRAVGSAISIVGALVIGQAAVQAGIVSPAMVIVVAITAIANFATPSFTVAISARLIRFAFMLAAATFGFYGIILGLVMLTVHLTSLRSFGVPYLAPIAPVIPSNIGDTLVRMPMWAQKKRPKLVASDRNETRVGDNQKPKPDESRGMKRTSEKNGGQT